MLIRITMVLACVMCLRPGVGNSSLSLWAKNQTFPQLDFPTAAPRLWNGAVVFDSSTFLEIPWTLPDSSDFSIEGWVDPTSKSHPAYLLYWGDSAGSGLGIAMETNYLPETYATINVGGRPEPINGNCTRVPLFEWTHLAMVKSGDLWLLYKNGELVGRGHYSVASFPPTLTIGRAFLGRIAGVRIWKRAIAQEEIRRSAYDPTVAVDSDLVGYYATLSDPAGSVTKLTNHASGLGDCTTRHARPVVVESSAIPYSQLQRPTVTPISFPRHLQFFPRTAANTSHIPIHVDISGAKFDSAILDITRNDVPYKRFITTLTSINGVSSIVFDSVSIPSECALYTLRLSIVKGTDILPIIEAADVVSGDAYFVNGQSNAHAPVFGHIWQNPYSRTLGIQTGNWNLDRYDPVDTLWGMANASGWGEVMTGPYLAGGWAFGAQEQIASKWNTPTCVINGGAGATRIDQHYRNDTDLYDLSSVYGRALYRLSHAGLLDAIRAIFWYQGEYDQGRSYYDKFLKLYREWKQDIPQPVGALRPQLVYVFQVRPGCETEDAPLREVQRELADSLPNVRLIATNGISDHDGCHYGWFGYGVLADRVTAILGRDFYHLSDTIGIDGPNMKKVEYADSLHTTIAISFRESNTGITQSPDTLYNGKLRRLADAFKIDGDWHAVSSVSISGDIVTLHLSHPVFGTFLSYLPDKYYPGDSEIYEGPWILNKNGRGALSFDSVRIEAYTPHPSEGKPVQLAFNVRLLANPFEGYPLLSVSLDTESQVRFRLYDITGRASYDHLFELPAGTSTLQLPFSGSAGTYILESNVGKDYQRIHLSSLGH